MILMFFACWVSSDKQSEEPQHITEEAQPVFIEIASITPEERVNLTSELLCSAIAVDDNEEVLDLAYEWSNDQDIIASGAVLQLSPGRDDVSVGDTIVCRASVEDVFSEASVVIENVSPEIETAVITPDTIYKDSTLQCNSVGNDLEDGELSPSILWKANDMELGEEPSLDLSLVATVGVGDSVRCIVTVTDSNSTSFFTEVESTPILNSSPIVEGELLVGGVSSVDVYNDSSLEIVSTVTDVDEEITPGNIVVSWTKNGLSLINTEPTLNLMDFEVHPGDEIEFSIDYTDSSGSNSIFYSPVYVVLNRAPVIDFLTINPSNVYANDTLGYTFTYIDPDGEDIVATSEWRSNTLLLGSSESLDLSVLSSPLSPQDEVELILTVTDPSGEFDTLTESIEILNTVPVFNDILITSTDGTIFFDSELNCTSTVADIDDGVLSETSKTYTWTNLTTNLGLGSGSIYQGPFFNGSLSVAVGDNIQCEVVAEDLNGATVSQTTTVTVQNHLPTISNIALSSMNVYTGETVTCTADAYDQEDGSLAISYEWSNLSSGAVIHNSSSIEIQSSNTSVGDIIQCMTTAIDYNGGQITETVEFELQNTLPEITNSQITYSDNNPFNTSVYNCLVQYTDIDQDLDVLYSWTSSGGQDLTSFTESTFVSSPQYIQPGQDLSCDIWLYDAPVNHGIHLDQSMVPVVTVINRPFSLNGISFIPSDTTNVDDIICNVLLTDEDQDTTTSYEWVRKTGVPHSYSGQILPKENTWVGDAWACTVSVTDGEYNEEFTEDANIIQYCEYNTPGLCDETLFLGSDPLGEEVYVDFSYIPSVTDFNMGPSVDDEDFETMYEELVEGVEITRGFYMMTTEMTQGMYEALGLSSSFPWDEYDPALQQFGYGREYPVFHSNQYIAATTANEMTDQYNSLFGNILDDCYFCSPASSFQDVCTLTFSRPEECTGFRLPTEAEWEYAARAESYMGLWSPLSSSGSLPETTQSLETMLIDGTDITEQAWYTANMNDPNYGSYAKPVALLMSNSYNLFDMAGNVGELCEDYFNSDLSTGYPLYSSNTDPFEDPYISYYGTTGRSFRGGAYNQSPAMIRPPARQWMDETVSPPAEVGFRLIRSLPPM